MSCVYAVNQQLHAHCCFLSFSGCFIFTLSEWNCGLILHSRWKRACIYWSRGLTAVEKALCSGSLAACGRSTAVAYTNPLPNICSTFLRGIHRHTNCNNFCIFINIIQQWGVLKQLQGLIVVLVSCAGNVIHWKQACVHALVGVANKETPELY